MFSNFGMLPMEHTSTGTEPSDNNIYGGYLTLSDSTIKPLKVVSIPDKTSGEPTWDRKTDDLTFSESNNIKLTVGMWKSNKAIKDMIYKNVKDSYASVNAPGLVELTLAQGTLTNDNETSRVILKFPSGNGYYIDYKYNSSESTSTLNVVSLTIRKYTNNNPASLTTIFTLDRICVRGNAHVYTTFCKKMGKLVVQVTGNGSDPRNNWSYYQRVVDSTEFSDFGASSGNFLLKDTNSTFEINYGGDSEWCAWFPYCLDSTFDGGGGYSESMWRTVYNTTIAGTTSRNVYDTITSGLVDNSYRTRITGGAYVLSGGGDVITFNKWELTTSSQTQTHTETTSGYTMTSTVTAYMDTSAGIKINAVRHITGSSLDQWQSLTYHIDKIEQYWTEGNTIGWHTIWEGDITMSGSSYSGSVTVNTNASTSYTYRISGTTTGTSPEPKISAETVGAASITWSGSQTSPGHMIEIWDCELAVVAQNSTTVRVTKTFNSTPAGTATPPTVSLTKIEAYY